MKSGATFSSCRKYRYELWRVWDAALPAAMIIGLNPSTADESSNDPTIRRCIDFAQRLGYGGLTVCNLFAYCATEPREMLAAKKPVGRNNDGFLIRNAELAGVVIAAWGNTGYHLNRSEHVVALIPNLHCLKINASGEPAHPLYLPRDSKLSRLPGADR